MKTILELERPRKLDQLVGIDDIIELFKRWNERRNHPHSIVHGPWGVGKSASVRAMLYEFYGSTFQYNVVYSNASRKSERSIEYIEQIIKKMRVKPQGGYPYRVFVFEEGEQLTGDAEKALKEAMVEYSSNAKVFIITNHIRKVDGGIKSRCADVEFFIPDVDIVEKFIMDVYNRHVINYPDSPSLDEAMTIIFRGSPVPPRDALVKLDFIMSGGKSRSSDKSMMSASESIIKKLILSVKKPISKGRLLHSIVSMYDEVVANVGNCEREMFTYMFEEAKENFDAHPMAVGHICIEFAEHDVGMQTTHLPGAYMMSFLTKLTGKFGEKK